jgi:hypothetical protein
VRISPEQLFIQKNRSEERAMPGFLYHGTTAEVARITLNEGIAPRCLTGKSNWKHGPESNENMVYLTDAYAPFFCLNSSSPDEPMGIVEVDLKSLATNRLFPDEDFLEQVTRDSPKWRHVKGGPEKRSAWFRDRIDRFQPAWQDSLTMLGNVGFNGVVAPGSIRRISTFNPEEISNLIAMHYIDQGVFILQRQFNMNKYSAITDWFMGVPQDAKRVCFNSKEEGESVVATLERVARGEEKVENSEEPQEAQMRSGRQHLREYEEQIAALQDALDDHSAITVLENPLYKND